MQPPPAVPVALAAGTTRRALLSTTGVAVAAAPAPFLKPAVKPALLPVPPAAGGSADAARAAGGHGGRRATLLGHEQLSGEAAQRQPLEEPQQEEEAFEVVDSDEEDEDEEADRSYEPRSDSGRQRKKQRVNTGGGQDETLPERTCPCYCFVVEHLRQCSLRHVSCGVQELASARSSNPSPRAATRSFKMGHSSGRCAARAREVTT